MATTHYGLTKQHDAPRGAAELATRVVLRHSCATRDCSARGSVGALRAAATVASPQEQLCSILRLP